MFPSRIISMMLANQLQRKRNSLKIVKIYRNAEHEPTHLQFKMASFLFKRRRQKLSLSFLCLPYHLIKCQEDKEFIKQCKNCECCHNHSLFKGHNVNVNIVILNCQKCNQCLKCQVSGHKCLGLIFESVL